MLKRIARLIALGALAYIGACLYLYLNQRAYLYAPTPPAQAVDAESIALTSHGETLRLWRIGPAGGNAVIYFGGNGQDVAGSIPLFVRALPGRTIYLLHYRGYGGSSGSPSEAALLQDALTVFDFVQKKHAAVSVMGQSLGSGVAVFTAAARKVAKLVLITPYDSIEHVAQAHFPLFPVSLLLKDKFAAADRAGGIAAPTLVLLAEEDEMIPRRNSEALIAAFRSARPAVAVIPGATHNTMCASDDECLRRVREFL
jgi:pimeloyl-ACP methyl ester carboxylesterase